MKVYIIVIHARHATPSIVGKVYNIVFLHKVQFMFQSDFLTLQYCIGRHYNGSINFSGFYILSLLLFCP
jgi:hypothetical protein